VSKLIPTGYVVLVLLTRCLRKGKVVDIERASCQLPKKKKRAQIMRDLSKLTTTALSERDLRQFNRLHFNSESISDDVC